MPKRKIVFRNYWKTKVTVLIQIESILYTTSKGSRRVTYLSLLNFGILMYGKPRKLCQKGR